MEIQTYQGVVIVTLLTVENQSIDKLCADEFAISGLWRIKRFTAFFIIGNPACKIKDNL